MHVDVYFPQRSHFTHPSLHTYTDSPIEPYNSLPLSENSMYAEGRLPQDWDLPSLSNSTYHASYHTLDDIYSFLRDLAAVYPDKVKIVPLGHTGESRELYALEIGSSNSKSHDPNGETNEKLSFLITGTQHAREVGRIMLVDPRRMLAHVRSSAVGRICCCSIPGPCASGQRVRAKLIDTSTRRLRTCVMSSNLIRSQTFFYH